MAKEVAVKAKQEVAMSAEEAEMFGSLDYSTTETKDLLIPKVLLMQGSSNFIKEGADCKVGDLVKSTTGEIYGSVREKDYKPLKFIPIYMFKTWVKQEKIPAPNGSDKLQWVETTPVTPENTNQAWNQEEEIDGVIRKFKYTKNVNFYALLEKDFTNPMAIPHVITFRGTSQKGGSILEDWFAQCHIAQVKKMAKDEDGNLMVPFAKIFELGGKMDKNDSDQSWFKLNAKENSPTPANLITVAFSWYKTVSKSKHTDVDNSDDKSAGATAHAEEVPF